MSELAREVRKKLARRRVKFRGWLVRMVLMVAKRSDMEVRRCG